jgi:hypothetical protein
MWVAEKLSWKGLKNQEKRREQENHNVGRFSSCSTDFSQQIALVVLFLFLFFSFKTVGYLQVIHQPLSRPK